MQELYNVMSGSATSLETEKIEIWFHEDCVSWMADIRLVGHVILGRSLINKNNIDTSKLMSLIHK